MPKINGGSQPVFPPAVTQAMEGMLQNIPGIDKSTAHKIVDDFEQTYKAGTLKGTNLGTLGANDPAAATARQLAGQNANVKVDWKNPEQTLDKMSQFGAQDNNDSVRCGAAILTAGGVASGPKQFDKGLNNVAARGNQVAAKYQKIADGAHAQAEKVLTENPPGSAKRRQAEAAARQLNAYADRAQAYADDVQGASDKIQQLADSDPTQLNQQDLQDLQGALYTVANADQRLVPGDDKKFDDTQDQEHSYLQVGTLNTYEKLMWGGNSVKLGGENVSPSLVQNGAGGSHFVLANKKGEVAYNPWPEQNGTAYVRGIDGDGPTVVGSNPKPGQIVGKPVSDYRDHLPSRG